jgi:TolB-like protein
VSEIFISYARSTAGEAQKIAAAFRALGYGVWRDDELLPHQPFAHVIRERLIAAKAVIVIWSAEAVQSDWVQSEANHARAERKLVQVRIDRARLPMPFDRIQCADLSDWAGAPDHPGWRKVVASVAVLVRGAGPPPKEAAGEAELVAATGRLEQAAVLFRNRRILQWVAGLSALVALMGVGLWLVNGRATLAHAPHRIAVVPFDVVRGGAAAKAFAGGLLDDLVAAMSANQVEAVSRTDSVALRGPDAAARLDRLGAGLLLDGDVEDDGASYRVRMHLDDVRDHVTLWSKVLSGPAGDLQALQERVATRAAAVARWAMSPQLRGEWKHPSLIASYLEGQDEHMNEGGGRDLEIARRIVAQAPRFAAGHLLLAASLIDITRPPEDAPPGAQPQAVAESIREAKTALKLDPKSADAWAILALDTPLWAWNERERLLARGLAAEPDNHLVSGTDAWFQLYDVGRTWEAVVLQKHDQPDWVPSLQCLASELLNALRSDEARSTIARARRLAPDYWEVPISQFSVLAGTLQYAAAEALLKDPGVQRRLRPEVAAIYQEALEAAASGDAARKKAAADRVSAAARDGTLIHRDALAWLAGLGDLDGAFREAGLAFTPETLSPAVGLWYGSTGGTGVLFSPSTAAMRRDPRFMALAARIGLVDYWRSTGRWPDFCYTQPGLLYDCQTEAARLKVQTRLSAARSSPPLARQ